MSGKRGSIKCELAYAQGKMLDNSSWLGHLHNKKCTPMDVDWLYDNRGSILFAEFSSKYTNFDELKENELGEYLSLKSLVGNSNHVACLCKHSVPISRVINSRHDVDSFQSMTSLPDGTIIVTGVVNGAFWDKMVIRWGQRPESVRQNIIDRAG